VGTKPPRKEANATEMQGYLWMKKTKTDEKWKRRYFVLKDHRMFYYKSENVRICSILAVDIYFFFFVIPESNDGFTLSHRTRR
jgi:hypothetical protein